MLKRASPSAQLDGGSSRVALRDLALGLDDSKLSGRLAIEDFDRVACAIFDLALDRIDIDRYPPPGEDKAAKGRWRTGRRTGTGIARPGCGQPPCGDGAQRCRGSPRATSPAEQAGRALSRGSPRNLPVWWRDRGDIGLDGRRAALAVTADEQLGVAIGLCCVP